MYKITVKSDSFIYMNIITKQGNELLQVGGTFEQCAWLVCQYIDKNREFLETVEYKIKIQE